jgi:hypothetical protein
MSFFDFIASVFERIIFGSNSTYPPPDQLMARSCNNPAVKRASCKPTTQEHENPRLTPPVPSQEERAELFKKAFL